MRRIQLLIMFILIFSLNFMGGCQNSTEGSIDKEAANGKVQQKPSPVNDEKNNDKIVELKLWSWFSLGGLLKEFQEANPGIIVTEKLFEFSKCPEEYMKALTSGEGPDVLVFDSGFFGQYTVNNVLQDLYEPPFSADKYKNEFLGFESGLSIDKKQLLSLTISTAPYITLYRQDIMKENGFPSDPYEFGKFIEKPENIMKISKKLKEKQKYILIFPTDLTDITGSALGFFDDNLNYIRKGDLFSKAIDMTAQADRDGLFLDANFWSENGKKAIMENELAMFFLGSYSMDTLGRYAPMQKGKWRVTVPPFGLSSWASDSRMAINIQSSYKEEAWKLMEYIVTQKNKNGVDYFSTVPSYIPYIKNPKNFNRKHAFFGDQNVYPILAELANKMPHYKLTPMDDKALAIYRKTIWTSAKHKAKSSEIIEKMIKETEMEIIEEKNALMGK
ncbi:MAG TPA: extracellular solute-binding protein [Pseudobacteroides sp.]|uniref:ABC transporter substrate-binding protein n=1 Tax=Pseudobacteroides sp. TaxID=1968840 RepID=UPI002F922528